MATTMHVHSAAALRGASAGSSHRGSAARRAAFQQQKPSAAGAGGAAAHVHGGRCLCCAASVRASSASSERAERSRRSHAATTSSTTTSSSSTTTARRGDSLFTRASADDAVEEAVDEYGIPLRNLRGDLSAGEYAELKAWLFQLTAKYGAALTLYSTLGYGVANGLSAAVGVGGSLAYLVLLGQHVDEMKAGEIDEDLYTRNLVYEPVTDVFGMLGGAFGGEGSGGGISHKVYNKQHFN
jgi:hypothetical protein